MSDKSNPEAILAKLVEDVQSLKGDIAAALADRSHGTIFHGATDAANAIGAEAQRLYDGVAEEGRRSARALGAKVDEQPLLSLLMTFGIGFLVGRILPR